MKRSSRCFAIMLELGGSVNASCLVDEVRRLSHRCVCLVGSLVIASIPYGHEGRRGMGLRSIIIATVVSSEKAEERKLLYDLSHFSPLLLHPASHSFRILLASLHASGEPTRMLDGNGQC